MERASFETERLFGIPLSVENYDSFEKNEEPKWDGITNPYRHLIEGPSPLLHRIPKVKTNAAFAEIGIVLAVLKSTKRSLAQLDSTISRTQMA